MSRIAAARTAGIHRARSVVAQALMPAASPLMGTLLKRVETNLDTAGTSACATGAKTPSAASRRMASGVLTARATGKKYHQPWKLWRPSRDAGCPPYTAHVHAEEIPPAVEAVAAQQVRGVPPFDVIVHLPEAVEELRGGHGKGFQRVQKGCGNSGEQAALPGGIAGDVLGHGAEGESVGAPDEEEGDGDPGPVALLARPGMQHRDRQDADGQEEHGGKLGEEGQCQADAEEDGAPQRAFFQP